MAIDGIRVSILIVDDEMAGDLLARSLNQQYSCAASASAEEAIRLLEACPFDVVITDLEMSGASGLELCRHIRKTYPDTIVLVMSGTIDSRNKTKALQHGAFDYIPKPLNLEVVERLIEFALLPPSA